MSVLEAVDVVAGYGGVPVVKGVTARVPEGKVSVIIGANACGKSTLLKAMARLLPTESGAVLLDGQAIAEIPTKELARSMGLLPQSPIAPEGIVVADLVSRGRHPYQRIFRSWSPVDDAAVAKALAATGIADLADQAVDELSGGQRQRVWIAMALAQETDVLLLDEPTTYLDVARQIEVLDLLTDLNRSQGTTIVMVLHDMNMAARYADHVFAMADGAVVADGAPREVMTSGLIRQVFELESVVIADPVSGAPLVVPIGKHHSAGGLAVPAGGSIAVPGGLAERGGAQ